MFWDYHTFLSLPLDIVPQLYQADEGSFPEGFPWPVEPTEELEIEERSHREGECGRSCPYGYQSDVEGRQVCRCAQPCQVSKLSKLDITWNTSQKTSHKRLTDSLYHRDSIISMAYTYSQSDYE